MAVAALQRRFERGAPPNDARTLAQMVGLSEGQVSRVLRWQCVPGRSMVIAIARAQTPEVPVDRLLLAAGYAPETPALTSLAKRLAGAGADTWQKIDTVLDGLVSECNPRHCHCQSGVAPMD